MIPIVLIPALLIFIIVLLMIPFARVVALYLSNTLGGYSIYVVALLLGVALGYILQHVIEAVYGDQRIVRETKAEKVGKILMKTELVGTSLGALIIAFIKLARLLKNIKEKILSLLFIKILGL